MDRSKRVKSAGVPGDRSPRAGADPERIMQMTPAWSFSRAEREGPWPFSETEAGADFWQTILPRLASLETMTWGDILISAQKENHSIPVGQLNRVAQQRLRIIRLDLDLLVSIRVNGTHRLYGFLSGATFVLLRYDKNHGDNNTCVCRSRKKHT